MGALPEVGSRAEAQRLIGAQRVLVDGVPARKRDTLSAGSVVEVHPTEPEPLTLEPEPVPFEIRYEDDHLLVIDKPAGIVVHPSRGHEHGTLVHGLLDHGIRGGEDPFRPGIVHRLDRDTSGLLIVARSNQAHRRLQRMLKAHEIDRRYLALVHGTPDPAMSIDRPIGRHPRDRLRMAVVHDGRHAVTHVRVVEALDRVSLCEVRLETGRTHQIRVHLEAVGFPVVGDPLYGRGRSARGLERQFLHSAKLRFDHPVTPDFVVEVESPLPEDLARVLEHARGDAPAR